MKQPRKAAVLLSGGLDSMLAAQLLLDQDIQVTGITFFTGFCTDGLHHMSGVYRSDKVKRNNPQWVAEQLGIPHTVLNIMEEYKDIVINPKHGYGANMNPCIDCKVFMVGKAMAWIRENEYDFVVTGEVVGQRPKSQRKLVLPIISKESGANDLLLRPLSARLLPETLPEREGWIDREKLLDISGRSRKVQIELATKYGFDDYTQPSGGCCVLTEESYTHKLQDFWSHKGEKTYDFDDIMLLNVGRHIRPSSRFKLIVSREEPETRFMEGYRKSFHHIKTISHSGPITLIEGENLSEDDLTLAARITARYSKGRNEDEVEVQLQERHAEPRVLKINPIPADDIPKEWYL